MTMMEVDTYLSQLLGSMTIDGQWQCTDVGREELAPIQPRAPEIPEESMSDSSDSEDSTYQPSPSASSSSTADARPHCGCVLLQSICGQICEGRYGTTGGEYLEAIFTHREAFFAYPQGHRTCAVGFSDLAQNLERRGWRADREGDAEAVAAFRHESWVIAHAWSG